MHRSFSYRCFHYVVATTWVWQNLVSSASFLIILCFILIYLQVVWRTQWDERLGMCHSFSFLCFHYVVATTWVWQNCFISYHLMLYSNLFTCRLKGPVKQETCDMSFFFISMFSLCSSYNCVCTVVFTKTPWLKPVPMGMVYWRVRCMQVRVRQASNSPAV